MSEQFDYDLFVIGGGSGGVRSARWAASLGAKVAICEEDRYGGTCVLRGCIPKKMMVYGSHFADDVITSADYGWDITINGFDWEHFRQKREKELSRLSGLYAGMLERNNVDVIKGKGSFVDTHTIKVGEKSYTAKYIIIAVGGRPWVPDFPGKEFTINSNDFFELKERPKKVVINGGGFIGLEFACLLKNFGSEVHIVIRRENVLRGFDSECACYLKEQMLKSGIHFHEHQHIKEVEKKGSNLLVKTEKEEIPCDQVIMATGREPYTQGLGLDKAGLEVHEDQSISVDDYSQTKLSHIYAVGDVTNRVTLTPVALQEGMLVAENLFRPNSERVMTYEYIPSAVFSQPPLATVGLSEEEALKEAREKGEEIEVYASEFRPLKYTLGERQKRSLMKMIVSKKDNKVLGLHMVGDDAPEIIQGFAVALKAGATKDVFDRTIGLHPSSAEEFVTMRTPR